MTREEIIKKVEEQIDNAPQYHFERDLFCNMFEEVFGAGFVEYELFDNRKYKSFILWNDSDGTWYIYSKQFDVAIAWYKHLGRINQCTNEFLTLEGLKTFLIQLKAEFEEQNNG